MRERDAVREARMMFRILIVKQLDAERKIVQRDNECEDLICQKSDVHESGRKSVGPGGPAVKKNYTVYTTFPDDCQGMIRAQGQPGGGVDGISVKRPTISGWLRERL